MRSLRPFPPTASRASRSRTRRAAITAGLGLAILAFALPAVAAAGDTAAPPSTAAPAPADPVHLGAAVAIGLAVLLSVAGVGCAIAVISALFPRLSGAMERQTRQGATGSAYVGGSLVLLGVLAAVAGLGHAHHGLGGVVAVALGLPALLLMLAGALGTFPLLGERLLGPRGASASPLTRSVTASVALGLAFLPGVVLHLYPIAFLVALAATGWPLGVGIAALLARVRPAAPAPTAPPPAPTPTA